VGGGTGLPVLLSGLRQVYQHRENVSLTAVVCVSDNGGSSGSLRESFGIPAVGDLRNCLVALAEGNSPLGDLFQHRLGRGGGLHGHALGNLVMTALCERTGSLCEAVVQAAELLGSWGSVLPSTEDMVTLCARFEDGAVIRGETQITRHARRIGKIWLESRSSYPKAVQPASGLIAALHSADLIVFGPGSLYTSIIPNLLVPGVADAVGDSGALKVLVCNLLTQAGETDGFTASDHLGELQKILGERTVGACILNSGSFNGFDSLRTRPVVNDVEQIRALGVRPVLADVVDQEISDIRHDPVKLAVTIAELASEKQTACEWEPELCSTLEQEALLAFG